MEGHGPSVLSGQLQRPRPVTSHPAGPLGGLVVHELSWVDAILFVKLQGLKWGGVSGHSQAPGAPPLP